MHIVYFDESKASKGRPFYWLGAILADPNTIWRLEAEVNGLAVEVFGTPLLTKQTEFHAADLWSGHEHFRDWDRGKRINTLHRLVSILGNAKDLRKIYIKIVLANIDLGADAENTAFMYMVERVDMCLKDLRSPGMLVGDRESDAIASKFADRLSGYRGGGTDWDYSRKIEYLIDTVHFTHSHHSRMLQLADLHVWLRQFLAAGDNGNACRKGLIAHVNSIPDCLSPSRYKVWPNQPKYVKTSEASG